MLDDNRSERITIRFTPAEVVAIEAAAAAEDSPMSSWCHDLLVNRSLRKTGAPREIERQILAKLSEMEELLRLCAGAVNPYHDLDLQSAVAELRRRSELEVMDMRDLQITDLNELRSLRNSPLAGGLWQIWQERGEAGLTAAKAGR